MRLDQYLVASGLAVSRSKAKEMIENGSVSVGGKRAVKASFDVLPEDTVSVAENPLQRYVGRGGLKLEAALKAFGVSPCGRVAVDIGASSGGFTDCLLQNGAAFVYAVDSGEGQLHPTLREDNRVFSMEKTNARYLDARSFDRPITLAVMDVSFISQTLLFPAIACILPDHGELITLVKPQFEVGRDGIGKNGIVKDPQKRARALQSVLRAAETFGLYGKKTIPSPITGGDGNMEYLAYFVKGASKTEERV